MRSSGCGLRLTSSFGFGLGLGLIGVLYGCSGTSSDAYRPSGGSGGSAANTGGRPSATGGSSSGGATPASGGAAGTGGIASTPVDGISFQGIATWRNDAHGAYSIIHDDLCSEGTAGIETHADRELTARGLSAGMGAIAGTCEDREYWDVLQRLATNGHEIVNHSYNHSNLGDGGDYQGEIDRARDTIETQVATSVDFFIFPFDAYDDTVINHLRAQGYFGARTGERGVNDADFTDPIRTMFDVRGPTGGCGDGSCSIYGDDVPLRLYVDDAIESGGWALQELHGVDDGSWGVVPLSEYAAHLDYVKAKVDARELWMANPSEVIRYRMSRQHCGTPTVRSGGSLTFDTVNDQCRRYATELSVILNVDVDTSTVQAFQGSERLDTVAVSQSGIIVNMNPALGEAKIVRP
jgi:hypothetical protein